MVTYSHPTSESGVRISVLPQTGKLVVACRCSQKCFTGKNLDHLYELVSITHRNITSTQIPGGDTSTLK